MKIVVDQKALRPALARCGKVARSNQNIPILGHFLVEAGDAIRVRASNMETTVSVSVEGAVAEPGAICIPADEAQAFVSRVAGSIEIVADLSGATLRCGRASIRLHTLPAAEFPKYWGETETLLITDGDLIRRAMSACATATERGGARFYLDGVFIDDRPDGARFVSTDGHRLHMVEAPGVRIGGSAIIPTADAHLIAGLEGDMRFHVSERRWGASAGSVEIWGRVIDGSFPDYPRVIAQDATQVAVVDSAEMLAAIAIASIGTDADEIKARPVTLSARGGEIVLAGGGGKNLGAGASQIVNADVASPMEAEFSAAYLTDAINAAAQETIALAFNDHQLQVRPAQDRPMFRALALVLGRRAAVSAAAA